MDRRTWLGAIVAAVGGLALKVKPKSLTPLVDAIKTEVCTIDPIGKNAIGDWP